MSTMKTIAHLLFIGLILISCTDLADNVEDGIGQKVGTGGADISNPAAALTGVYVLLNDLRGAGGTFALMEHPSDEMIGPTRGTDWSDFGVWRQLHAQTWDPSHTEILNAWNQLNQGVFRATQVIDASSATNQQVAEARFLRAFFMFYVMDFYGQVPFRASDAPTDAIPEVMSRAKAFDYIVQDLTAARPALPDLTSGADAGTASKQAIDFLLAKLYLNKAVYMTSTSENPSVGPFTFDNADMDEVIARVDNLTANPYLQLTENYFDNFHWENTTRSDELIFVVDAEEGSDASFTQFYMTLHYNDSPSGCCNGFTTIADFYDKFSDGDSRKSTYVPEMSDTTGILAGFLIGQQYDHFNGGPENPVTPLKDRGGNSLVYTEDVDLLYSNERQGVRVIKYLVYPENYNQPATDYIFFRYADALLMQAEAYFREGNTGQALSIINNIRTQRNATPLSNIDEQAILDERGFELYWEGWRRNDQIRFGTFTQAWNQKEPSEPYRALFPIPQRALDTNPNLVQNSGY